MAAYEVLVEVALRPGIADPQGATIERALPALGFTGVSGLRSGKAFRFSVEAASAGDARQVAEDLSRRLLTNPVIEDGRVTVAGEDPPPVSAVLGVVTFPGTNCEHDVVAAVRALGGDARLVWHGDAALGDLDGVILPGGFAHGDYLRPGAIARFSPVMAAVAAFAADGGPVVGICNGFQVLTEAHLLPGALQKNAGLSFLCTTVALTVASSSSVLTADVPVGTRLRVPINHFEGSYTCDPATLDELRAGDRIVLRYADNPNGSVDDIAGIANPAGNVVGLMPHPERACDPLLGSDDGRVLLGALLASAGARVAG